MEDHPMPRLNDTQTIILSAAASHEMLNLLPVPASVKARGAALDRTLAALLKRGFASEAMAINDDATWRRDPDGQRIGLIISHEGLAAIGVETQEAPDMQGSDAMTEKKRPAGKLGTILEGVERADGATLADLTRATGWLPHTTRAALTRLRQRGFDIHLETIDGRKAYRLAGQAA
jgi:hypothetical protein